MPATRRLMACDCFDRVLDDVAILRRGPYTSLGRWSLPQVCRHLSVAMESAVSVAASGQQTPEQADAWRQFMAVVFSPAGLPPGRPLPNPALEPPADCGDADCGDAEYARLTAAIQLLVNHPHSHVSSPRFGPVPTADARRFHLAHANHHLSFLRPATARRFGLEYPDVPAALADVAALRRAYVRTGNWNLAQVAYHVAASLRSRMTPGDFPPDTPEQLGRRPLLDRVLSTNEIPTGLTAPDTATPPPDLTDDSPAGQAAVDDLVTQLNRFAAYLGPFAPHRLFGHMTPQQNVRHQLVHAAHHLSHLVPVQP